MELEYPLKGIGITPGIYLTQKFGQNLNDYTQFGLKGHNGVDWGAPLGTPVLAVHDGRLETRPTEPDGYGVYVRVKWEEEDYFTYDTVYGHFLRIEGEDREVKAGEVIGYVDSTGYSTGNHLHFGIRKTLNGAVVDYHNGYLGYFDPEPYFRKEPMPTRFFIKDGAKIGAFVADGFALGGAFAKDATALESLKSALDFKGNEPTLELPPSDS